jgi:hypothetical protein
MTAPRDSELNRRPSPVVRPYAMTKGRPVRGSGEGASFGLIDVVAALDQAPPDGFRLSPEQRRILAMSRQPVTVVDLASDLELPVGVVRVLLGDLSEHGLVTVRPARGAPVTDTRLLRQVRDKLQGL